MTKTEKALEFARRKHKGQVRLEGTPYIEHPIEVAAILYSHGYRDDTKLAAMEAALWAAFGEETE